MGAQRRGRKEIQGSPQQLALSLEGCVLSEQIRMNGAGRRDQKQECYTSTPQVPCGTGSHTEGVIRPQHDCQSFDEKDPLRLTIVTPIHTLSCFFEAECHVAQGGIQFFGYLRIALNS